MTQSLPPPMLDLGPDTAPVSAEQRAWLNGFFAGIVSLDGASVTALSPQQNAAVMPGAKGPPDDGDDGEAPWHDQTLPMAERMKLADGRPLRRRMMAAMGQQDCGQCGYNCNDYSDAIFAKKEERLNLCVPGGKETARMLKKLYEEMDKAPPAAAAPVPVDAAAPVPVDKVEKNTAGAPGCSRDNPALAAFHSRTRLNKPGSDKETWHVEYDLSACGLDYAVGDCFGFFP